MADLGNVEASEIIWTEGEQVVAIDVVVEEEVHVRDNNVVQACKCTKKDRATNKETFAALELGLYGKRNEQSRTSEPLKEIKTIETINTSKYSTINHLLHFHCYVSLSFIKFKDYRTKQLMELSVTLLPMKAVTGKAASSPFLA